MCVRVLLSRDLSLFLPLRRGYCNKPACVVIFVIFRALWFLAILILFSNFLQCILRNNVSFALRHSVPPQKHI